VSSYIGCITGTSVDGLDIALVEITPEGKLTIGATHTASMDPALRTRLLALGSPSTQDSEIDLMGAADTELGAWIGEEINAFLAREDRSSDTIVAIGSHGQTIRHRPPNFGEHTATRPFTLQIGDPNQIAEVTGITTVADFRRRDMAAGGHGAPLVPPFHRALFGSSKFESTKNSQASATVVLNIGGISNISVFKDETLGFDTGPGNALMDSWCMTHQGAGYDLGGAWAASGTPNAELLASCLSDEYFSLEPPKSTGREYFNIAWLHEHLDRLPDPIAPQDVQATLCELTARSIVHAIERWAGDVAKIIVCGGGRLNSTLMQQLAKQSPALVQSSEDVGIDGDSVESAAFAWLAYRTIEGLSGNEPSVTGAQGPRILGAIYPGGFTQD